ncbi:BQ2448_2554 [Microbotryum intermedium]|uniref:BQ2448_2554 protein n=1 Tax=Microbotryum intermedium TaxID=269621 RepID=A0A238FCC8_9BASI|nr:BQ2448_2554 [Microbotryum intermedium]
MATTTFHASAHVVTATVTGLAGATVSTVLAEPTATAAKAVAASIFDPSRPNPVAFDASNPLILFIVQAFIIVALSRILAFFLRKLRQPQVIAEVIGGLLLGPSVFGRIPNFTRRIFPAPSVPYLNLVANLGLVLFLFLVGLETDFSLMRRNFKVSTTISALGLIIPFALGAAVSVGVYDNFVSKSVKFGTFLLFIGVANAITAFPVLARILTELDLLQNHVGVIVLAAGVGNDVVGWVLLALAIALVNASSGIIILYIVLTSIGWILTLWYIARPALVWLGHRTNSYGDTGPSQSMSCAVLFLVLASAWVTDRIGIHAIFGGFLVGLVVPVQIRASLTEKIEDLVTILFLPLYFALSGLKTDLGLLANGRIWGWTVCVIVVAFIGKFVACGGAAKVFGMDWRESGAIGSLMACKGLVEIIVLNIGLNAGILNPEVFAMFITMALVTTFLTTPLTLAFYPKAYRIKSDRARKGFPDLSEDALALGGPGDENQPRSRFAIVLEQFDNLPAVFSFCRLIQQSGDAALSIVDSSDEKKDKETEAVEGPSANGHESSSQQGSNHSISALRLIELTDRTSALLKASESQETLIKADSLTRVFHSFARGLGLLTSLSLSITSQETYASVVAGHSEEYSSDVVVLPWVLPNRQAEQGVVASYLPNPFDSIFGNDASAASGSLAYASFVRKVFADATCDVALFLERGSPPADAAPLLAGRAHLFLAFHGGSDDRACLNLLVQLVAQHSGLSATVVKIERAAEATAADQALSTKNNTRDGSSSSTEAIHDTPALLSLFTVQGGGGAVDTIYPTQNELTSQTADEIILARYFDPSLTRSPALSDAISRIEYETIQTVQPLHLTIARARATSASLPNNVPFVLVSGRSRKDAPSHATELTDLLKQNLDRVAGGVANSSEVRRSLGDVAVGYVVAGIEATSLLVLQAKGKGGKIKNRGS